MVILLFNFFNVHLLSSSTVIKMNIHIGVIIDVHDATTMAISKLQADQWEFNLNPNIVLATLHLMRQIGYVRLMNDRVILEGAERVLKFELVEEFGEWLQFYVD